MPPKAAKAPEKVVAKDEAQIVYVHVKVTAPAPVAPAPAANASQNPPASPAQTIQSIAESPSKEKLKAGKGGKSNEPAQAAAPIAAPVTEEMQEVRFEILANLLCRTDIFIDFIRRQCVKLIHDKLAAEDLEKNVGDPLRAKLKELQTELSSKPISELVLRDANGSDITFHDVRAVISLRMLAASCYRRSPFL